MSGESNFCDSTKIEEFYIQTEFLPNFLWGLGDFQTTWTPKQQIMIFHQTNDPPSMDIFGIVSIAMPMS